MATSDAAAAASSTPASTGAQMATDFEAFLASLSAPPPTSSTVSPSDDPFAFASLDTAMADLPVPSTSQLQLDAFPLTQPARPNQSGSSRARAPKSIFITSPTQRAQAQKREIGQMSLDKAKQVLRACEGLLADQSRLATLQDGGACVRARHTLLLARIRFLETHGLLSPSDQAVASSSSSSNSSSSQASNAMDIVGAYREGNGTADTTPLSVSPRSWTGGIVGFKQMLMDEPVNSEHGMSMRESIALQQQVYQDRKEAQALHALEQMLLEDADDARPVDAEQDGGEVVLDFDELSYPDDEGGTEAEVRHGGSGPVLDEPPDEEALWALAEAAGYARR